MEDYQGPAYKPFINFDLNEIFEIENKLPSYTQRGIDYNLNEFGFRGQDFIKNVDLLVLGCSNTFGMGLPEKYIWPNLLKSDDIKNVNSLASVGDSAMGQIIKFFKYINVFGNPKNLVGVFPAYRMEFPLEEKKWEISNSEENFTQINYNKAGFTLPDPSDSHFEKYSASPYDPNKIFTKQTVRYFTHTFINILEKYCNNTGINFRYTIYDYDYRFYDKNKPGESLKEYMTLHSKNYFTYDYAIDLGSKITDAELYFKCHQDKNIDEYFYRAGDFIEGKRGGHFGLHHHIHIAEAAKKSLMIDNI